MTFRQVLRIAFDECRTGVLRRRQLRRRSTPDHIEPQGNPVSALGTLNSRFLQPLLINRESRQPVERDLSDQRQSAENPQLTGLVDELFHETSGSSADSGPLGSFRDLLPVTGIRGVSLSQLSVRAQFASVRFQSSGDSMTSTEDRLGNLDPKMAEAFKALRSLLESFDPEAGETLDKLVGKTLNHLNEAANPTVGGPSTLSPPSGNSFTLRAERIQVAISTSITEIQQQADGSFLTSTQVQEIYIEKIEIAFGTSDPLVLDLNGNDRFDTTTPEDGHFFDILGVGERVMSATAAAGDALLAIDRNGNGRIDDGRELFGDQNGAADGFDELRRLDQNGDNRIDAQDPGFHSLLAFEDRNRNGFSEQTELLSLTQIGIRAIRLQTQASNEMSNEMSNGNAVVAESLFERLDGSEGRIGDLLFQYEA
jgi:hypothetical protein